MSFQQNLRKYRERIGISAKDFAAQIGTPYTTYVAYENQGREPKYDTLCKIAAALHVSIDDLLEYEPDKLQYWLDTFPNSGIFARRISEKHIELYLNIGDGTGEVLDRFTIAVIENDKFIATMEKIAQEAEKENSPQYELTFDFFVSRHFLQGINKTAHPQEAVNDNTDK